MNDVTHLTWKTSFEGGFTGGSPKFLFLSDFFLMQNPELFWGDMSTILDFEGVNIQKSLIFWICGFVRIFSCFREKKGDFFIHLIDIWNWLLAHSELDLLKTDKNCSQLSQNDFYVSGDAVSYIKDNLGSKDYFLYA